MHSHKVFRRQLLKLLAGLSVTSTLTHSSSADTKKAAVVDRNSAHSDHHKAWASGGTDLITVDFPPNRIFDQGTPCSVLLTPATTLGPCYFEHSTTNDISTGLTGLPTQLCLKLLDSHCQPLSDYTIDVWHCDTAGVYSADAAGSTDSARFAGALCSGGDKAAAQSAWYRGKRLTDRDGRVNFKTCFPGWYPGRSIHIHFRVSNRLGSETFVSQFCFSDALAREIYTTHPRYRARGDQDTPLASGSDGVFPASGYDAYVMETQKNADGTLLAYHTIQIP